MEGRSMGITEPGKIDRCDQCYGYASRGGAATAG